MSIGSFTFSGEECTITINEKGSSNNQLISGKVTSIDASGFTRNVGVERTIAAYRYNYDGYNPATININFVYDQDPEVLGAGSNIPMIGFMGGSFETNGSISGYQLNSSNSLPSQKIKLLFREYSGTFKAALTDSERAMAFIFYNAQGTKVSSNIAADGILTGQISFFVSPFDISGSSNYVEFEKPAGAPTGSFNAAEGSYDTWMGY